MHQLSQRHNRDMDLSVLWTQETPKSMADERPVGKRLISVEPKMSNMDITKTVFKQALEGPDADMRPYKTKKSQGHFPRKSRLTASQKILLECTMREKRVFRNTVLGQYDREE